MFFDGSFKSKPKINLGGNSRIAKPDRNQILEHTHLLRQQRELERKRNTSAITIQKFFRAHLQKWEWRNCRRSSWDVAFHHYRDPMWISLARDLVLFFDITMKDSRRLLSLVQAHPHDIRHLLQPHPGIISMLTRAAIRSLPCFETEDEAAVVFSFICSIASTQHTFCPFFNLSHIPHLISVLRSFNLYPLPRSVSKYLCLAAHADPSLWLMNLLPVPDLLLKTQLYDHVELASVLPQMTNILATTDSLLKVAVSDPNGYLLCNFIRLSIPTLLAAVSGTVASFSPTNLPFSQPTKSPEWTYAVLYLNALSVISRTYQSFFLTPPLRLGLADNQPGPVLRDNSNLRQLILDADHILALYAVADGAASMEDFSAMRDLCICLSPLLPYLSIAKSPFVILTRRRPGFLSALYTLVMNEATPLLSGRSDTFTMPDVEQLLDCLDYRWSLSVLADTLFRVCSAAGDDEFYQYPWLSQGEIVRFADCLRTLTFFAINYNNRSIEPWVLSGWVRIVRHLHDRDSRRPFTPSREFWSVPSINLTSFVQQVISEMPPAGDYAQLLSASNANPEEMSDDSDDEPNPINESKRNQLLEERNAAMSPRHRILRDLPFVLPFTDRVYLFRTFIGLDRDAQGFAAGINVILTNRQRLTIRRDHVFEDAFVQLTQLGSSLLRTRLAISFVSELGTDEAGIDGGGIFKEFFTLLSQEAFHPSMDLFLTTQHEHALYPNPNSSSLTSLRKFEFVGKLVGKALYEGILLESVFAPFFINHWLQHANLFDDLPSLDPELYRHLVSLKNMQPHEVESLALNFTAEIETDSVSPQCSPGYRTIELTRNGTNIPVTASNRIKYMYLKADLKLNQLMHRQCRAFLSGLSELIRPEWLQLFNQIELSRLVSGVDEDIDMDDMRLHTVYGGEYTSSHPVIRKFWQVTAAFGPEDRRFLLRFMTSCTRAPLLGFQELVPSICIRPGGDNQDWLPSASTCVNLLKLPLYQDISTLRNKLLYAIRAGVGFELS